MGLRGSERLPDPRWSVATVLAGSSLVPDLLPRVVPDLVPRLGEYGAAVLVGAVAGLSVVGEPVIGLALAWLLFVYLVFAYVHYLYPDEHAAAVRPAGFRVLTALCVLFFGVVVWGTIVPDAVPGDPGALVGATGPPGARVVPVVWNLLVGVLVWSVAFGSYLRWFHPEAIIDEDSELTAMMDGFFYEGGDGRSKREAFAGISGRWRTFSVVESTIVRAFLPVTLAVVVGLVGVLLNLFYPLPEAVFLSGLVAVRVLPEIDLDRGRPGAEGYDLEVRLLDSLSGALRNDKGMFMLLYAALGTVISAVLFANGLTILSVGWEGLIAFGTSTRWPGTTPGWPGPFLAAGHFGALLVALLLAGAYSLLHWLRQFERIDQYARYWESAWLDQPEGEPAGTAVPRPPGLLLPAHLPFLVLFLGTTVAGSIGTTGPVTGLAFLVGETALLVGAVSVSWWGMKRAWRPDRGRPVRHETRDLTITLVLQVGLFFLLSIVEPGTLSIESPWPPIVYAGALLGIPLLLWVPDAQAWSKQFDDYRRFVADVPSVLLFLDVIVLLEVAPATPPRSVQAVVVLLAGLSIAFTAIDLHADRLADGDV